MQNKRPEHRYRKKILCWILASVIMVTGIPASAAGFDAPDDLFSSGNFDDSYVSEINGQPSGDTGTGTEPGTEPEISIAPEEDPDLTPAVTPTEEPTGTPSPTEEPQPTVTPEPDKDYQDGDILTLKFMDQNGESFYQELEMKITVGASFMIPDVPGYEGNEESVWKLDKDKDVDSTITFDGRKERKLSSSVSWWKEYVKDGEMILYAVPDKACVVKFCKNGGTDYSGGTKYYLKGTTINLPDFPASGYVNFGWTMIKGGTTVKFNIGEEYKVTGDATFYMVRYAASKVVNVTFLNSNGSTNSSLKILNTKAVKNGSLKLPALPTVSGYQNLGWAVTKNAASAKYPAGKTITVTKNLTLYAVRKKINTYTVTFNNNTGTSTSKVYTSLTQKVKENTYMTLPAVPTASGYTNLGWTTAKGKTTPLYKTGGKLKITKSTKLYAVRRKSITYTVTFYYGNGKTDSAYKALQKKVQEGKKLTLPSVPSRSGYVNLGWSTIKNNTLPSYKAGASVTVNKNLSFYAVQQQAVTITLYYNDGTKTYLSQKMGKGNLFVLPSEPSKLPYTFMGWSTQKKQSTAPQYEAGQVLKISKNTSLYAVVFDRNKETDLGMWDMGRPNLQKYSHVIFVGDSRTNRMKNTLQKEFGTNAYMLMGVSFIPGEGKGLSWLKDTVMQETGSDSLISKIKTLGIRNLPVAVVFNLGVNDLNNASGYVSYMNSISGTLKNSNCDLFYMSVNPINSKMIAASGHKDRAEADIREFNNTLKTGLNKSYTFIDAYSWLMKSGYGTDSGKYGTDTGIDDGLHYTTKTYKRIYNFCMQEINNK